jgi:hypothetical protein
MHSDDLSEVIVPEGLEEIVTEMTAVDTFELPSYVSSSVDPDARTAEVVFSFANSFDFDLTLNMIAANIRCVDHGILLGHAESKDQVEIESRETEDIVVVFVWSADAEEHFLEEHTGESVVDVKLVDMEIDVSGVTVEVPDEVLLALPIADSM